VILGFHHSDAFKSMPEIVLGVNGPNSDVWLGASGHAQLKGLTTWLANVI